MERPNNGGRNPTTFYYRPGRLYDQSVTIVPANGDYTTPNGSRFVESLLFNLTRMNEEAGGTPPNVKGCGPEIQPFVYKYSRAGERTARASLMSELAQWDSFYVIVGSAAG